MQLLCAHRILLQSTDPGTNVGAVCSIHAAHMADFHIPIRLHCQPLQLEPAAFLSPSSSHQFHPARPLLHRQRFTPCTSSIHITTCPTTSPPASPIHLSTRSSPAPPAPNRYSPNQHANSLCTCWTTSKRIGAVNTAGRATEPELSPLADQTVTVGRAAIFTGLLSRLLKVDNSCASRAWVLEDFSLAR